MNSPRRITIPKRRWFDKWREIVAAILSTVALFSVIWAKVAMPEINNMIDKKQAPLLETMEYQNCLIMADMPDSVMKRAEYLYKVSKMGRPKP